MLADYADRIQIAGEAGSVAAGIALIDLVKPDLLFLDVELTDGTGFDILDAMPGFSGRVIFVTAFEKYAVRAFRSNAIDYLLKPVGTDELSEAVARTLTLTGSLKDEAAHILYRRALLNAAEQRESRQPPKSIVISSLQGMQIIEASSIAFIEADNTYSNVHFADGNKITASRPLLEFEEILNEAHFFRVHRSYLVNVTYLRRFISGEACAELTSGKTIPVSRRKAAAFSSFLRESVR